MITVTMSATSNTAQAITIMSITFTPPSSLSAPGLVILERFKFLVHAAHPRHRDSPLPSRSTHRPVTEHHTGKPLRIPAGTPADSIRRPTNPVQLRRRVAPTPGNVQVLPVLPSEPVVSEPNPVTDLVLRNVDQTLRVKTLVHSVPELNHQIAHERTAPVIVPDRVVHRLNRPRHVVQVQVPATLTCRLQSVLDERTD